MVCSRVNYNTSWICASFAERGWLTAQSWFLYMQQFNRDTPYAGYIEATISVFICLVGFIANFYTMIKIAKGISNRPEFVYLFITYCICNLGFLFCGIILGISRATDTFIFGKVGRFLVHFNFFFYHYCTFTLGCIFFFGAEMAFFSLALWVLALVGSERVVGILQSERSNPIYRLTLGRISTVLGVILICNTSLWGYFYGWVQLATTKQVYVYGFAEPVTICSVFNYRSPQSVNVHAPVILIAAGVVPLAIGIAAYMWVTLPFSVFFSIFFSSQSYFQSFTSSQ